MFATSSADIGNDSFQDYNFWLKYESSLVKEKKRNSYFTRKTYVNSNVEINMS